MQTLEDWWAEGEAVELTLRGAARRVFRMRTGEGPPLTLLHGFPSSSHDYARVAPELAQRYELLAPDFLGFGASAKPTDHAYSIHEQADLVEALWSREGIRSSRILAHDYAVSVTQELLARRQEGELAVELVDVLLLNGGLYPDLHRPQPTQVALLDREQGPRVSALIDEQLFVAGLAPTFAEGYDARSDCEDIWRSTAREDGHRIAHLLIRYMSDRREHAARWTGALESTDVPLAFVWGMLDPVSGAHMAERIRERLPRVPFEALETVAHWPQLEAPERVIVAVLRSPP